MNESLNHESGSQDRGSHESSGLGFEGQDDFSESESEKPAAAPKVPAYQGREAWVSELKQVEREARKRGDDRPTAEIMREWLKFRRNHASHDEDT